MKKLSEFVGLSKEDIARQLQTSLTNGLSTAEAAQKKQPHLHQSPYLKPWWKILLHQYNSPLMYILLFAAGISFFLQDALHSITILAIIAINGLLSFVQEFKAEQNIQALQKYLNPTVLVVRDGREQRINASDMVRGDLVILHPGTIVPADLRLIRTTNLTIDESQFSGESLPILKDAEKIDDPISIFAFQGTVVLTGTAQGIALAIGKETEFSNVAALTVATKRMSSFQNDVRKMTGLLVSLAIATLLIVFVGNLFLKWPNIQLFELLMFSLALAVTIVPEALPIVITLSLARASVLLAKEHVIVKRLSALEDLGSITVLCADKTGTLTENKLAVTALLGDSVSELIQTACMIQQDLDSAYTKALHECADKKQIEKPEINIIEYQPFDPLHKYSSLIFKKDNQQYAALMGAPDKMSQFCTQFDQKTENWIAEQEAQGARVLALCIKRLAAHEKSATYLQSMQLLGCISFSDVLKGTAHQAITQAQHLGIRLIMISGDSLPASIHIAKSIGLISSSDQAITGDAFEHLPDDEKMNIIENIQVFARVNPTQKYQLIEWYKQKNIVGYIGEGINDGPALKAAHVGIAADNATDVARDAADIVLLESQLLSVIKSIELGRQVFANMMKYIKTVISSIVGNFYSLALVSFFIDYPPMLPIQLLLLNILADVPMIMIGTDHVTEAELKRPSEYRLKEIAFTALIFGLISSLFDFIFFGLYYHVPAARLQTTWFIESLATQIAIIFILRTGEPLMKAALPSAQLMIFSFLALVTGLLIPYTSIGQLLFSFIEPRLLDIGFVASISLAYFITTEVVKILYHRLTPPNNHAHTI
jgi:P-type Mg2+ transporter